MIQSFIGALLGGIISGLINWLLYKRKEIAEARKKHFEELKEYCIRPLLNALSDLMRNFNIEESLYFDYYLEAPSRDVKWWENFSFEGGVRNKLLYEDLRNHFKGFYEELKHIEEYVVRELYSKYLILMRELVLKAKSMISNEFPTLPNGVSDRELLTAIMMIVLVRIRDIGLMYMRNLRSITFSIGLILLR